MLIDVATGLTWMHSVLGWIKFCGEEVCHENHENVYTMKFLC